MQNNLETAKHVLLDSNGLDETCLNKVLNCVLKHKVDSVDLFFKNSHFESWSIEDGIIKDASYSIDQGVGISAFVGDKLGFAYSDELNLTALMDAAVAARTIAKSNRQVIAPKITTSINCSVKKYYDAANPLLSMSSLEKIAILKQLDSLARAQDNCVKQVFAHISGSFSINLILTSAGNLVADVKPLVSINLSVVACKNGRTERAFIGGGARTSYALFTDNYLVNMAQEAVRQVKVALTARAAPAGNMPVILGPGWPGVLLHEAVGHGLEGDFNRKQTSVYANRIGDKVASSCCTIVDNGTLAARRGSLNIDDEGTLTQCTTLIEQGILKGYMQDKLNAKLMGTVPTGNGRRESYAYPVMPRMTNTYMLAGNNTFEEIIQSVDKGIYAVNFRGGQVDITSGKFVFDACEAYYVEQGKIQYPVVGATLIGNGPEVMTKVTMVGNDLELDNGIGVCGKNGQRVPVGVGQPTILVSEMTVGGTQYG